MHSRLAQAIVILAIIAVAVALIVHAARQRETVSTPNTVPGIHVASTLPVDDPIVPADQLHSRLLTAFGGFISALDGRSKPAPEIAEDWTQAIMQLLATKPPLSESQFKTLVYGVRRCWDGTFYGGSKWKAVNTAMHPLHYVLVRELMLKRVSDFLDSYQSEAIMRPKAIAQLHDMAEGMLDEELSRFPTLDPKKARSDLESQFANILQYADDPFFPIFKQPASAEDLQKVEKEWLAPGGLLTALKNSEADKPGSIVDDGPFMVRFELTALHGYWDRTPIGDPPSLVAAQKALDQNQAEIAKYEEEQAAEAAYSAAEEYVPSLPLALLSPRAAAREIWGDEVHGVQVRLLVNHPILSDGEPIALSFQLRNNSASPITFHSEVEQDGHQLEVDGVRYIDTPLLMFDVENGRHYNPSNNQPIRPSHRSVFISLQLDGNWRAAKPGATYKEMEAAPVLKMSPGEHKVRFIYQIDPQSKSPEQAISNEITLTIQSPTTAPATLPH